MRFCAFLLTYVNSFQLGFLVIVGVVDVAALLLWLFFVDVDTVFFSARFGDFFLETTSTSSGTPSFKSFLLICLAVGRINGRANGKTTRPIIADKAANSFLRCLVSGDIRQ